MSSCYLLKREYYREEKKIYITLIFLGKNINQKLFVVLFQKDKNSKYLQAVEKLYNNTITLIY